MTSDTAATNRLRILVLASLLAGIVAIICFGMEIFIFERLDPYGAGKEYLLRENQYAQQVRLYRLVGLSSFGLSASCAILALVFRRRQRKTISELDLS